MARAQFDWAQVLDIRRAVASAKSEMYGDWLRDPWSWPELSYLADHPDLVAARLEGGRTRFERLSVPKVNFGTRPAVVQSPADRIAFHGVVNAISLRVAGDLPDFVSGWRLQRGAPQAGVLARNQQEWLGFIAGRQAASAEHASVLATDITNFFGSISLELLSRLLYAKAGSTRPVDALVSILQAFNELPDRAGIPQRSTASSVLANAFLGSVDDILDRYANSKGAYVSRWMDDIWVLGGASEDLRCLQLDLQDELRNIGLEINLGKTKIREGAEAEELLGDADLERDPPQRNEAASGSPLVASHNEEDLERQLAKLVERPEMADRTAVRYVCARIRDFDRKDLVPPLIEAAPQSPQGADHYSRLFGRSGHWRDLADWYVGLAQAPGGLDRLPWPIAQLGTMFPSDTPVEPVAQLFGEALERSSSPPIELLAVAAHRLSKWKEPDARVLLRRIGSESDSPLCRRTAAIALHNLGEDYQRVRSMLSEFEENASTRAFLDDHGHGPVPGNADFDPVSA